jgi:hypothetical protein
MIVKMMAVDPQARLQSMVAVRDEVKNLLKLTTPSEA